MRSWIGARSSFAAVVMIVHELDGNAVRGFLPTLPQAGEGKERKRLGPAALEPDAIGPLAVRRRLPLVEAVGRHQAAPRAERGTKGRLFRQPLGARVDQPVADRGILGPGRDEAPAQLDELARGALCLPCHLPCPAPRAPLLGEPHHGHELGGCNVVARGKIGERSGKAEEVPHRLGRRGQRVASAHGPHPIGRAACAEGLALEDKPRKPHRLPPGAPAAGSRLEMPGAALAAGRTAAVGREVPGPELVPVAPDQQLAAGMAVGALPRRDRARCRCRRSAARRRGRCCARARGSPAGWADGRASCSRGGRR